MLNVEGLSKSFNKKLSLLPNRKNASIALRDINFRINSGDRLAILGHNGSGKSTLLKTLFGSITPDNGQISWKKHNFPISDGLRKVSAIFNNNDRSFFWRLTVRENLNYFNSLNNVNVKAEEICDKYGNLSIKDILDVPFMSLSSGQKKKVALFRGLIKNPEIIFFDEFTDSLDINNRIKLKNLIKEEISNNLKKTIIWVTHSIDEAKEICNKILILENGSIKHFDNCLNGSLENIDKVKALLIK